MFIRPALLVAVVLTLPATLVITSAIAAMSDADLIRSDRVAATDTPQAAAAVLATRRRVTLWHTGDTRYVTEVLPLPFVDRMPPTGHVQDTQGSLDASEAFCTVVPDMCVKVEDMAVVDDHVSVHLRFRGHFIDELDYTREQNQPINFQAFGLYRIADGRIVENWYFRDNQTLLQQVGPQP